MTPSPKTETSHSGRRICPPENFWFCLAQIASPAEQGKLGAVAILGILLLATMRFVCMVAQIRTGLSDWHRGNGFCHD